VFILISASCAVPGAGLGLNNLSDNRELPTRDAESGQEKFSLRARRGGGLAATDDDGSVVVVLSSLLDSISKDRVSTFFLPVDNGLTNFHSLLLLLLFDSAENFRSMVSISLSKFLNWLEIIFAGSAPKEQLRRPTTLYLSFGDNS
jgi:hypothetical protein